MAIVKEKELTLLYIRIAEALGASSDEAEIFSKCMVRADLRGMYTQGSATIPYSVWIIQERLMRFGAPFKIKKDEPYLHVFGRAIKVQHYFCIWFFRDTNTAGFHRDHCKKCMPHSYTSELEYMEL